MRGVAIIGNGPAARGGGLTSSAAMTTSKSETFRIRESAVRVGLALVAPPLLAGLALLTWTVLAPPAVPIVFAIFSVLLAIVVMFDFPLAIELGPTGLTRLCLLRRHTLLWEDIAVIIKPKRRGLLIVTKSRKKHVLIDRILEESERKTLLDHGDRHDVQVEL